METNLFNDVKVAEVLGESVVIGRLYSQEYLFDLSLQANEQLQDQLRENKVPEEIIHTLDMLTVLYLAQIELAGGELTPVTAHSLAYGVPEITRTLTVMDRE